MKTKIVYLEGRPRAHILHRRLAESITDEVEFIDARMRWQDRERSPLGLFISWVVNALYLGRRFRGFDCFLIDNLHFTPVIMNCIYFFRRKPIIVHLGSHTMYFLYTHRFSGFNEWLHLFMLRQYDAVVCEGEMTLKMVRELLGKRAPACYVTFLGPPKERLPTLLSLRPNLISTAILIIANGPGKFRMHYKGLDLMIAAFQVARREDTRLSLTILGEWDDECKRIVLTDIDADTRSAITFAGKTSSIDHYLVNAGLCLHCSRGDAFPTSTIEALVAGVPTLVSEWTGTREIVGKVEPSMILPTDPDAIGAAIVKYFQADNDWRNALGRKLREAAMAYTEERAIEHYQEVFGKIKSELGLKS